MRNQRDSLRESAVVQLYLLAQHPATAKAAIEQVVELASDSDPRIRQAVFRNLATLFAQAPAKVWKFAESFTQDEEIPFVLGQLVATCLGSLRNQDPRRVKSMVLQIREIPYALPKGDGDRDLRAGL